jgi:hypothetical protein
MIQQMLTSPRPDVAAQMNVPGAPGMSIGGGIAGVASTVESPSIKIYNERQKYNEWEFVYDMKKDKRIMGAMGGQMGGAQPPANMPGSPLPGSPPGGSMPGTMQPGMPPGSPMGVQPGQSGFPGAAPSPGGFPSAFPGGGMPGARPQMPTQPAPPGYPPPGRR